MTRILTVSTLFPNPAQPNLGLFVAERLRHLLESGRVEARVIAPVPWFPSSHSSFGKYAVFARVPDRSHWQGIEVLHPRYAVLPGPGWYVTPLAMKHAIQRAASKIRSTGFDFDLIDAHYYFPDGVSAALAASSLKRPLVITARGTDINLIPDFALARSMILFASRRAAASICVSAALRDRMIDLGVEPDSLHVLRNGVDTTRFRPIERTSARLALGLPNGHLALCVGNLIETKGQRHLLEALALSPTWRALLVGDGVDRVFLENRAAALGVSDRVRFVGPVAQSELPTYYSAADALVLPSSREGMPNVILEALACGTPVVATRVGGVPEAIADNTAGLLLEDRSAAGIASALAQISRSPRSQVSVRERSLQFAWEPTIEALQNLMVAVAAGRR